MRWWGSCPFGGGVGGGRFAARTVAVRSYPRVRSSPHLPYLLFPKLFSNNWDRLSCGSCLVCVRVWVDYDSRVTNHDAAYERHRQLQFYKRMAIFLKRPSSSRTSNWQCRLPGPAHVACACVFYVRIRLPCCACVGIKNKRCYRC